MSDPVNLDLIPTDELILAVANRYDFAIFMGRKMNSDVQWDVKRRYKGDIYLCLGLADNMADFMNDEIKFQEHDTDGKGT